MKTKQQAKTKVSTKTKGSFGYPKNPVVHPGIDSPLLVLKGPIEVLEDPKWLEIVRDTYPEVDKAYRTMGEYTDKQFHADLRKASRKIKDIVSEALRQDAKGNSEIFPK